MTDAVITRESVEVLVESTGEARFTHVSVEVLLLLGTPAPSTGFEGWGIPI